MVRTKKYKNGEVYTGKIRGGKREYFGHYHWPEKGDYIGEWFDDMMNGNGKYTFVDGRTFQGQFVNDMMCGRGCYYTLERSGIVDKEIFGDFTNGVLNGRGVQFSRTPDLKGIHVMVGVEFRSGKLERGLEFIVNTEGVEDKILDLKQYKKNLTTSPGSPPSSKTRKADRLAGVNNGEEQSTDAPQTPRALSPADSSANIEYVEFFDKQRFTDYKKEIHEKHKNAIMEFQNQLSSLEGKLSEEKNNNPYEARCKALEAELQVQLQKVEEAKQTEQQMLQQVHQQRKLFEAFEVETNRHNRAMTDHISELESKIQQNESSMEVERQAMEQRIREEMEIDNIALRQEIEALRAQLEASTLNATSSSRQEEEHKQKLTEIEDSYKTKIEEQDGRIKELASTLNEKDSIIENLKRDLASPRRSDTSSPRSPSVSPRGTFVDSPRSSSAHNGISLALPRYNSVSQISPRGTGRSQSVTVPTPRVKDDGGDETPEFLRLKLKKLDNSKKPEWIKK